MMDDYDFVTAEIEQLVNESIKLTEDYEILLGAGSILSIDTIASEFNAANVLAPYTAAFASPTLAELTGAMKAQIYTFGAENAWEADTILMNYNDWVKFMHEKNAEGDYLLPNFVSNGSGVLNGMRVVTSPIVAANTLYVFDSSKGQILERQGAQVEMSYENQDNFEHEVVTVKAVERIQFHVPTVERDAFMKCSDIAAALTAITKP
jgi:HK97 family phage major capsid protein